MRPGGAQEIVIIHVPVGALVIVMEAVEWGVVISVFQAVKILQFPLLIGLVELMYLFKRRL